MPLERARDPGADSAIATSALLPELIEIWVMLLHHVFDQFQYVLRIARRILMRTHVDTRRAHKLSE